MLVDFGFGFHSFCVEFGLDFGQRRQSWSLNDGHRGPIGELLIKRFLGLLNPQAEFSPERLNHSWSYNLWSLNLFSWLFIDNLLIHLFSVILIFIFIFLVAAVFASSPDWTCLFLLYLNFSFRFPLCIRLLVLLILSVAVFLLLALFFLNLFQHFLRRLFLFLL